MEYDEEAYLTQAHPIFRFRLERILSELRGLGWQPRIVYVKRSAAEQAEKLKRGYSKTMKSWHLDSTVGMLADGLDGFDVVHGNAADIVDKRYGWGGLAAHADFQFWKDLGRLAKKHGCSWGGDWKKFKDVAHVELLFIEMPSQKALCA